ncbi:MBL fold metallo-hydrolase [Kitasatospora sp. NPDC048407]|uniref:MBL fold metallo-hydrolase n=1 Tax=Kitasatospora sp. NPDC048407 TaxID=3364051 RepID=UPI00371B5872
MNDNTVVGRRGLLRTAVAGAALLPVAGVGAGAAVGASAGVAAAAETDEPAPTGGETVYRWLGNSGWRIEGNGKTVLFDPYITRYPTNDFDPKTKLAVAPDLIDQHIGKPDLVLVSHCHWDHFNDVPYIAKHHGVQVVGTATACHLLRAMGVKPEQLIVVKGGEYLDFGGFTVQVVASLHSRNAKHQFWVPGTLTGPPATAPRTIGDLPEGDTLAFQVRLGDGPSALLTGAADFSEQHYAGLKPDIAMLSAETNAHSVHRYVPRLLKALDHPRTVIPVHWDSFETPLTEPAVHDTGMDLDGLINQTRELSPQTRLIRPEHLTPLRLRA